MPVDENRRTHPASIDAGLDEPTILSVPPEPANHGSSVARHASSMTNPPVPALGLHSVAYARETHRPSSRRPTAAAMMGCLRSCVAARSERLGTRRAVFRRVAKGSRGPAERRQIVLCFASAATWRWLTCDVAHVYYCTGGTESAHERHWDEQLRRLGGCAAH
ncbi:hypothetical protein AcV7_001286 [Taiwanofungus camphoratus]|nr:hypothetical protein AcW2_000211 [Antrodia cinnamomea]KAI0962445.1 hypothetical protein AcV7_001286 [Antrodia cinnamomea]